MRHGVECADCVALPEHGAEVTLPHGLEVGGDPEAAADAGEGAGPGEARGEAVVGGGGALVEAGGCAGVAVGWVARCEGLRACEVHLQV